MTGDETDSRVSRPSTHAEGDGDPQPFERNPDARLEGGDTANASAAESDELDRDDHIRELVAKTAEGDRDAWEDLWRQLGPAVAKFLAGRLGRPREHPLVEDIMSETFIRVRDKASDFRGDAKVSTWVMGIALNAMREAVRRDSSELPRDPELPERSERPGQKSKEQEAPGLPENLEGVNVDLIEELVATLPPAQQQALRVDLSHPDKEEARRGLEGAPLVAHRQNVSRGTRALIKRIHSEERFAPLRPYFPVTDAHE